MSGSSSERHRSRSPEASHSARRDASPPPSHRRPHDERTHRNRSHSRSRSRSLSQRRSSRKRRRESHSSRGRRRHRSGRSRSVDSGYNSSSRSSSRNRRRRQSRGRSRRKRRRRRSCHTSSSSSRNSSSSRSPKHSRSLWREEARENRKRGQCFMCGMKIYRVVRSAPDAEPDYEPITLDGLVLNGRCLACHPLRNNTINTHNSSSMLASASGAQVDSTSAPRAHVAGGSTRESEGNHGNTFDRIDGIAIYSSRSAFPPAAAHVERVESPAVGESRRCRESIHEPEDDTVAQRNDAIARVEGGSESSLDASAVASPDESSRIGGGVSSHEVLGVEVLGEAWVNRYNEAKAYYSRHDNLDVKKPSPLNQWLRDQRSKRKRNPARYSNEKVRLLNELNFDWSPQKGNPRSPSSRSATSRGTTRGTGGYSHGRGGLTHNAPRDGFISERWMNRYNEVKAHHSKHNNLNIKRPSALNQWLVDQRAARKCNPNTYSKEKVQLLNEVNFDWSPQTNRSRHSSPSQVVATREHVRSSGSISRVAAAGQGRNNRRENLRPGQSLGLSSAQVTEVSAATHRESTLRSQVEHVQWIGEKWMAKYKEAKAYHSSNGNLHVHYSTRLNKWLRQQRYLRRNEPSYSPQKVLLLDQLGFDWTRQRSGFTSSSNGVGSEELTLSHTENALLRRNNSSYPRVPAVGHRDRSSLRKWMTRYNEAKAHLSKHGNLRVKSSDPLSNWFCTQRYRRKSCSGYSTEKVRLLDELGFDWECQVGITSDGLDRHVISNALKNPNECKAQEDACKMVRTSVTSKKSARAAVAASSIEMIVGALEFCAHEKNVDVMIEACGAIGRIADFDEEDNHKMLFARAKGIKALVTSMRSIGHFVFPAAVEALHHLCASPTKDDILSSHIMADIFIEMSSSAAFTFLRDGLELAQNLAYNEENIANDTESEDDEESSEDTPNGAEILVEDDVIMALLTAFKSTLRNEELDFVICEVLCNIADSCDKVRLEIAQSDLLSGAFEIMKKTNKTATKMAVCRVLEAFSFTASNAVVKEFVAGGTMADMTKAMDGLCATEEFHIAACLVLQKVHSLYENSAVIGNGGVVDAVLRSLRFYPISPGVQKAAFDALRSIGFPTDADVPRLVAAAIQALKRHPSNTEVQESATKLLKHLASLFPESVVSASKNLRESGFENLLQRAAPTVSAPSPSSSSGTTVASPLPSQSPPRPDGGNSRCSSIEEGADDTVRTSSGCPLDISMRGTASSESSATSAGVADGAFLQHDAHVRKTEIPSSKDEDVGSSSDSEEDSSSDSESEDGAINCKNDGERQMSAYEMFRERNIARNEARLQELGLMGNSSNGGRRG